MQKNTTQRRVAQPKKQVEPKEKASGLEIFLNILTAIIYPVVLFFISTAILPSELVTISLILNAVFAVCVLISGFYLIIIPLPFIYFYRFGLRKGAPATAIKVIFTLVGIACGVCSLLVDKLL